MFVLPKQNSYDDDYLAQKALSMYYLALSEMGLRYKGSLGTCVLLNSCSSSESSWKDGS